MARFRHARDDWASEFGADSDTDTDSSTHDAATLSEEAPLLATDLPSDISPSKSFQNRVLLMCVVFLFIVEIGQFIMEAPLQKIMEDVICRNYYPDHALNSPRLQDNRCKNNEVQSMLAMVRGWGIAFENGIPMIAQFPFGIIADKYGRRIVLLLSVLGIALQTGWTMAVLLFPNTFSIWAILPGNLFFLIGGGGPMASAMVWTILADAVPVANRTTVFFQLMASILILSVLVNPLSAWLLHFNPWIAMWTSLGCVVVGTGAVGLIPETLTLRREADDRRRHSQIPSNETVSNEWDENNAEVTDTATTSPLKARMLKLSKRIWFTVQNDMRHVWKFIFGSKSIMLLVFATAAYLPIRLSTVAILIQYISKRFDWEWSTATFVSNAGNLSTVVSLLIVLPVASYYLTEHRKYAPLQKDIFLARATVTIMGFGLFIMSFSSVPWLFITSLVITCLGNSFSTITRALLSAVVEPHTLATLNTTISLAEAGMSLASGPLAGWLLSRGMELGGVWQGLPFFAATILAAVMAVAVFAFRLPSGVAQTHEEVDES